MKTAPQKKTFKENFDLPQDKQLPEDDFEQKLDAELEGDDVGDETEDDMIATDEVSDELEGDEFDTEDVEDTTGKAGILKELIMAMIAQDEEKATSALHQYMTGTGKETVEDMAVGEDDLEDDLEDEFEDELDDEFTDEAGDELEDELEDEFPGEASDDEFQLGDEDLDLEKEEELPKM